MDTWLSVEPDAQASIVNALRAAAYAQLQKIDTFYPPSYGHAPSIDVLGVSEDETGRRAHFVAHDLSYNYAQSGSDWADHYVLVGEARLDGASIGAVQWTSTAHSSLSERQYDDYDPAPMVARVRAEALERILSEPPKSAAPIEIAGVETRNSTRDTLPEDDIAELFLIGLSLESSCLPLDELAQAIRDGRVQSPERESSMGTANLYWAAVPRTTNPEKLIDGYAVLPPGQKVVDGRHDGMDERNIDRWLWQPFFRHQIALLHAALPPEQHEVFATECAGILADLEEQWTDGDLGKRAPFVERLRREGPVDLDELAAWLRANRTSSRHLTVGLRARFLRPSVARAFQSVMKSAARFKQSELERSMRLRLLRVGAKLLRASR